MTSEIICGGQLLQAATSNTTAMRSTNITYQPSRVSREQRGQIMGPGGKNGFHGCTIWFTGNYTTK